jgi:uncharacterized protein YbbC (DUF1343 family)
MISDFLPRIQKYFNLQYFMKNSNNTLLVLVCLVLFASCKSSLILPENSKHTKGKGGDTEKIIAVENITTGAENYEAYLPLLKSKKVAVVTNLSGNVRVSGKNKAVLNHKKETVSTYEEADKNISIVDFLLERNKINVQKIFAPEHGFRGTADAGEHIVDGKDTQTGLPIISLYGDNKKPKPDQLKGIDLVVFDIQDVGVRFYTYISTLHYVMEACAENQIPILVLDRPNPNGAVVDGPILETEFSSFVGMHPVPVLYGMTIGEYAQMINGEKWLKDGVQCKLTVIPCLNYNREKKYSLPVKPSPNLPNDQSINLYASLCFFEGTNVSVGRGTEKQFQIYGSPFLPKSDFSFTPKPNSGAKKPLYDGEMCFGEDLSKAAKVHQLELKWLLKAYQETQDKSKFFNLFFTKLAGTKKLREQIEEGVSENKIRKSWKKDLEYFIKIRQKYLIYSSNK